jgi:hypothetical protein
MPGTTQMAEIKMWSWCTALSPTAHAMPGDPPPHCKRPKGIAVQNPLSSLAGDVKAVKRMLSQQEGPVLLVGTPGEVR